MPAFLLIPISTSSTAKQRSCCARSSYSPRRRVRRELSRPASSPQSFSSSERTTPRALISLPSPSSETAVDFRRCKAGAGGPSLPLFTPRLRPLLKEGREGVFGPDRDDVAVVEPLIRPS